MLHEIFDAPSILQAASEAEQSEDFWGNGFREGFEVLVPSMANEALLYPARAFRMVRFLMEILGTRARIAKTLKSDPNAAQAEIKRPIFITGLPRTGTTMLHNLMAGLPGFRAFKPWEMRYVVPPEDAGPGWESEALKDTDVEIRALYERTPELAKIHPMSATAPDECHWLIRHSFSSLIFCYMLFTPTYGRWLLQEKRHASYGEYKTQLSLLRKRLPEGRLVLKDPGHLWHLDELLSAFPDAIVVRLHRDPREAVPSLCSLMHALQRMDSARVDPCDTGPFALEMVSRGLASESEYRSRAGDSAFVDIEYRELVKNPMEAVKRICEAAGEELGPDGLSSIEKWLSMHPQHKAGRHAYTAEQFGLRPEELVERFGERG